MDKIKEIPKKVLEWWNKFSVKQKTLIASIVVFVIIGLVIVTKVATTPEMVTIRECENTKEAGEVKDLLTSEGIDYTTSDDGLIFKVNSKDQADAAILLGENGIPATTYELSNVFDGGFSTTEADKSKKYQLYLEEKMAEHLETLEYVKSAKVQLNMPVDDGTILAREQDTYAAVTLSLTEQDSIDEETAAGLAKWIATAIGNEDTNDVSIMDTAGNMLFMGADSESSMGTASSQLSYQSKAENMVKSKVKEVVLGTSLYDNVSVAPNLVMSFDQTNVTDHEYYTPEGEEHGPIDSESSYTEESTGGVAGVPGTDSNDSDDTTYVIEDGNVTTQTIEDKTTQYKTSEKITDTKGSVGNIDYDASSITLVATQYHIYDEDALRASGELDDVTFDEFVVAHRDKVKLDVDEDFVEMVARATGFSEDNIKIVAYEVPFFNYSDGSDKGITDYLPLIIAVLIMLMLGYVVFRSTRKEKLEDVEPELSVESLLSSTKEAQETLEDIGFAEKSETRVLIEKFVDENPEAAASLLRNWLNEEWE